MSEQKCGCACHEPYACSHCTEARAEVERLQRELGEHQFIEWQATVGRDVALGERGRLGATAAMLREALEAARQWWMLGHESCEWCVQLRGNHLPNCPGPLVETALAAADPDEWLKARIEREVESYRAFLRDHKLMILDALEIEAHSDEVLRLAALLGAPQDGAR